MKPKRSKIQKIFKAYKNSFLKDPVKVNIANQRKVICKKCDFYKFGFCNPLKCKMLLGKEICGCGCLISKKIYTDDKEDCPQKLWNI